jgi:hypothetical protein
MSHVEIKEASMRSTWKLVLLLAAATALAVGIGGSLGVAQGTPEPLALYMLEEIPLQLGCGDVLEEYLQFVDEEDIKLYRLFVQPGATVRVSVRDYGQPGDIWEACLTQCAQPSNVQTNVAIVPVNCTQGDGNTFEYSDPISAVADTGELCLAVRNLEGVGIWPAHMWLKIEVICGGQPGAGLSQAVSTVIQSVLFGQLQGVELYALPRPLAPGETVNGWSGSPLHVPGQESWYVFIDRHPGANYEHPVQHVFVSTSSGAITQVVDGSTPPRNLFAEMQTVTNVYGGAVDALDVIPAASAQSGAPSPQTPPPPPSSIPGQPETNPAPSPQNVAPQAFQNFVPAGDNLYVYYNNAYTTIGATPLNGWLPVYVFVPSPGTLWIYEYYQSTAYWNIQPFNLPTSGWHQLWFNGDVAGWHTINAYAGGSWTNWIHIYVGSAPSSCSVSPTNLSFGSVPVGSSTSQTFTITNNSGAMLSGSVSEGCTSFSVTPSTYNLLPGQSRTFTVTFAPTSTGTKNCTISTGSACANVQCTGTATPGGSGCVVTPTSLSFGSVPVGSSTSQTFTITNAGTGFMVGSVGEFCSDFSASPNLYFLGPGSSTTVTVTFTPTSTGTKTCTIVTSGSCANVSCTGVGGTTTPACTVTPTTLNFGSVPVGSSTSQAFTITNTGTAFLSGSIGESCSDFSVSPNLYFLVPGASVTVTVTFSPSSSGPKSCTISTGSACSNVTASGSGGPVTPTCSVSPTSLAFGSVNLGSSATQSFVITNSGSGGLSGTISESCSEFSVSPNVFFLSSGASVTVTVTFSPVTPGGKSCTINVSGACADVSCTGTGSFIPPVGQQYALLLSGGVDSANNHARYLNDLTEIYWTLRNVYGYSASRIFVLYADGSGPGWVTNAATRANLFSTFATLQSMMGSNDELVMFVTNHGGQIVSGTNQARIWLWNYESIADWEVANQVNLLPSGAKKYFVFGQCYSGGMVDNLAGPNRHIAAACGFNEFSWACDGSNDQGNCGSLNFDEFVMHWTAALTGSYPNGAPLLASADSNFDGIISLDEAFFYARNWDTAAETPQRSDVGGIGGGGL